MIAAIYPFLATEAIKRNIADTAHINSVYPSTDVIEVAKLTVVKALKITGRISKIRTIGK